MRMRCQDSNKTTTQPSSSSMASLEINESTVGGVIFAGIVIFNIIWGSISTSLKKFCLHHIDLNAHDSSCLHEIHIKKPSKHILRSAIDLKRHYKKGDSKSKTLPSISCYLAAFHCVCSSWMFDVKQRQKDNVFVIVVTSIQYWSLSDKAADAFYKLSSTRALIQSHVFDACYFEIVQMLVMDIEPVEYVKRAVSKKMPAIVVGLRDSVLSFCVSLLGTMSKDIMDMVLVTQYFVTLKEIGTLSEYNSVFVTHKPGAVKGIASQIRDGLVQSNTTQN
ncbi:hypothetical protein SO802_010921 [Lithocarpus litseifolius]|uniref:Uncharacterized protein n=1 Tax=Lithocarpus litseifolius TaxID=425828 RepID=A0AAW2DGT8_9ROSI